MYALLSPRYRAAHPYGKWESALTPVVHVIVGVRPGRTSADVLVRIYSENKSGNDASYHGTWKLIRAGPSWLLDAPAIVRDATLSPVLLNPPNHTPIERWLNDQPVLQHSVFGNLANDPYAHRRTKTMHADCFIDPRDRANVETTGYDAGCSYIDGNGIEFDLGPAGPEHYAVLYDPLHRLVWFTRGCCSENEDVLLSYVSAPPVCVMKTQALIQMRTRRGIRIGDSPSDVERTYGKARPIIAGAYTLLLYQYTPRVQNNGLPGGSCVQSSFAFLSNRLVGIDFLNSC